MMVVVFLLLLFYQEAQATNSCFCNGIKVQMSDQEHCFEIYQNSGSSWSSADQTCASIGGFMGHVTNTTLFKTLSAYIDKNYNLPVMTGAVVANVELDYVALMCPGNTFYALLNSTIISNYFNGIPLNNTRCAFITNDDTYKMRYMACDTSSNVLCDRPMTIKNYCGIKINCTETLTSTYPTSTTASSSTTAVTTILTKMTSMPTSTLTTTELSTTSVTQSSTKVTLSSTATLTSTVGTAGAATTSKTLEDCGKGHTYIFGWCVPWWCWLIFGLLLLLLLLCCFGWLCHFCFNSCLWCHKQLEEVDKKKLEGIDAICQTEANGIKSQEIVYVPVPKTPPPQQDKVKPVVLERQKTPPPTMRSASPRVVHHHDVVGKSAALPPSIVYDIKHEENTYTYNNYIIPPVIQQPQTVSSMLYSPERPEIMGKAPESYTFLPLPLYEEDSAQVAPTPVITQDVVEPVAMILHDPKTIITLSPKKKRPVTPEMPQLKHNRLPISNRVEIVPVEKRIEMPEPRTFPTLPSGAYKESKKLPEPEERPFPSTPPNEKRNKSIRKNTPLSVARQPQRHDAVATPPMDRLPTNLSYQVPSPESEKPPKKKRAKSQSGEVSKPSSTPSKPLSINHRESSKVEPSPRNASLPPTSEYFQPNTNASTFWNFREPGKLPESLFDRNSTMDPSMHEARGRLGGVRRNGPEGWKPWSKSSETFSEHPGYLNTD